MNTPDTNDLYAYPVAELRVLAADPSTPPAVLEDLAEGHGDVGVLAAVASNESCPPRVLAGLASLKSSEVAVAVATNPALTEEALNELEANIVYAAEDTSVVAPKALWWVKPAVAIVAAGRADGGTVRRFSDAHHESKRALLADPSLPSRTVREIAAELAHDPALDAHSLTEWAHMVISHPHCPGASAVVAVDVALAASPAAASEIFRAAVDRGITTPETLQRIREHLTRATDGLNAFRREVDAQLAATAGGVDI